MYPPLTYFTKGFELQVRCNGRVQDSLPVTVNKYEAPFYLPKKGLRRQGICTRRVYFLSRLLYKRRKSEMTMYKVSVYPSINVLSTPKCPYYLSIKRAEDQRRGVVCKYYPLLPLPKHPKNQKNDKYSSVNPFIKPIIYP